MADNSYKASTGVDEFYYCVLDSDDNPDGDPKRVKFAQEIEIEMPQEVEKAYGDNIIAEMAVYAEEVTLTSQFHRIPNDHKKRLYGLEESDEGLVGYSLTDNPPYVAVIFAKTFEDGSKEWVGLTKGMFLRQGGEYQTKEDGVEFGSDESEAEFMSRDIDGFDNPQAVVMGRDEDGETDKRDAMFEKLFEASHPDNGDGGGES